MYCLLWYLQSSVGLLGTMVVGAAASYRLKDSKQNFFLSLLLLSIFFTVSGESNASVEKLMETDKSTDQSNRSIDSVVTLNETINRANDMIISIPSIIILTLFIIFLSYTLRQKHNHQSNKIYASGRLMQLNQQNSFKEAESVKFTRSKSDTQTSASEVKPLRNMSEESELSRSVMASTSSEREDESSLQRKKSLIKKKKH